MRVSPTIRNTMTRMISDVRMSGNVASISAVSAVPAIDTKNNEMSSTSSELMKEAFYDKLEQKEKNMTKNKGNSNSQVSNPLPNRGMRDAKVNKDANKKTLYEVSEKDRETLDFLNSMIDRFNKSIENIKMIDLARGQNNFANIKRTIDENSRFLSSIGIYTDKLSHFYIKEDVFVSEIMKNPQKISGLLEPSTGVIRKLCDSFGKMLEY